MHATAIPSGLPLEVRWRDTACAQTAAVLTHHIEKDIDFFNLFFFYNILAFYVRMFKYKGFFFPVECHSGMFLTCEKASKKLVINEGIIPLAFRIQSLCSSFSFLINM